MRERYTLIRTVQMVPIIVSEQGTFGCLELSCPRRSSLLPPHLAWMGLIRAAPNESYCAKCSDHSLQIVGSGKRWSVASQRFADQALLGGNERGCPGRDRSDKSTTNGLGQFSFAGYTCPSASSLVYLVATSGNLGYPQIQRRRLTSASP